MFYSAILILLFCETLGVVLKVLLFFQICIYNTVYPTIFEHVFLITMPKFLKSNAKEQRWALATFLNQQLQFCNLGSTSAMRRNVAPQPQLRNSTILQYQFESFCIFRHIFGRGIWGLESKVKNLMLLSFKASFWFPEKQTVLKLSLVEISRNGRRLWRVAELRRSNFQGPQSQFRNLF